MGAQVARVAAALAVLCAWRSPRLITRRPPSHAGAGSLFDVSAALRALRCAVRAEQVVLVLAVQRGFTDAVAPAQVPEYLQRALKFMQAAAPQVRPSSPSHHLWAALGPVLRRAPARPWRF